MNLSLGNKLVSKIELIKLCFDKNYDYELLNKLSLIKKFNYYYDNDNKPCHYTQIFDELEIIPDNQNVYCGYFDILKSNFNLSCNILEVGGGYIPSFAQKIAKEQAKIGKGNITVYDPALIVKKNKYRNLKLKKEYFNISTHINDYNLIVGILPCSSTSLILDKALRENKEFFIALCGCMNNYYNLPRLVNRNTSNISLYNQELISYINSKMKDYGLSDVSVKYLDKSYNMPYPIVYSKIRKY